VSRDVCIAEQRGVLAARRELAGSRPALGPRFQAEAAASAALLARLLLEGRRPAEALACVDAVLPDHGRFVREEQEAARKRAAADVPSDKPAPPTIEGARPIFLVVGPVEPDDLELRRQWAVLLACRGAALAGLDRGPESAEAVRQAVALTEGLLRGDLEPRCPPVPGLSVWPFVRELAQLEPCYLYDLACHLALASTLPGNAGLADPASQAVRALRDHIALGFDDASRLRTDPALAPLRQRPDFQDLVRDLEVKLRGQGPT
jgi:hypothetical protein